MIITINDQNKVVSVFDGKSFKNGTFDNSKNFIVEKTPIVAENEDLYFDPNAQKFYTQPKIVTRVLNEDQKKAIREATQCKASALKWLADNDWMVNKRSLEEWSETDPRWQSYLVERANKRRQMDEADSILREIKKTLLEV